MDRIFNYKTIRQTLVNGLIKPNPSNTNIPMWTVEDFDQLSPGTQSCIDTCNNHPKGFPRGYQGIQYINPLEEFRGLSIEEIDAKINPQYYSEEKVQVIDPHDLALESNDPNRPF